MTAYPLGLLGTVFSLNCAVFFSLMPTDYPDVHSSLSIDTQLYILIGLRLLLCQHEANCQFQKFMRLYNSGCDWLQKSVRLSWVSGWGYRAFASPFHSRSKPIPTGQFAGFCLVLRPSRAR